MYKARWGDVAALGVGLLIVLLIGEGLLIYTRQYALAAIGAVLLVCVSFVLVFAAGLIAGSLDAERKLIAGARIAIDVQQNSARFDNTQAESYASVIAETLKLARDARPVAPERSPALPLALVGSAGNGQAEGPRELWLPTLNGMIAPSRNGTGTEE